MDKHVWKQVKTLSSSSHKPSSRWGHSSCVVGQDIVFFGGYADSNYMNDLWAFNSVTMKWRQIQTFGDLPIQRSNCSMNYDKQNQQIIIFGGGGANKQRFNSVSILNWKSKQWIGINPKQNEMAPWQRTYHTAEFMHPYLIVFGGEGVADMDDLWIFSFISLSWTEVKIPSDKMKPCARRFHSSVTIGNQFFILAGCHSKYRCLSDVFSMDLTSLLKTGNFDQLQWKQKKFKNSSFLTRWGHSSVVYDNKIYIFGGRFSNDLNDLLVADLENGTIKTIKTNPQAPPARRRHCAGFIGSSMLVFGGFNGQYFQDLYYISVHQARVKFQINSVFDQQIITKYLNKRQTADYSIKSKQDISFYLNIGLISKYFEGLNKVGQFLEAIDFQYTIQQLKNVFTVLYNGYGQINLKNQDKQKIKFSIPIQKSEKFSIQKENLQKSLIDNQDRKVFKKAIQGFNPIIKLAEEQFSDYYIETKQKSFYDFEVKVGDNKFLLNKIKLLAKSEYFYNLITLTSVQQIIDLKNVLSEQSYIVYQIFFNFLDSDWLVLPDNLSVDTLIALNYLADYFCIPVLSHICSNELSTMISGENVIKMLNYSIRMKLINLSKTCCDFWIKKATETTKFSDLKFQINKFFRFDNKICDYLESMFLRISFDLAQGMLENQKPPGALSKKTDGNVSMQKQNYETNLYNN